MGRVRRRLDRLAKHLREDGVLWREEGPVVAFWRRDPLGDLSVVTLWVVRRRAKTGWCVGCPQSLCFFFCAVNQAGCGCVDAGIVDMCMDLVKWYIGGRSQVARLQGLDGGLGDR